MFLRHVPPLFFATQVCRTGGNARIPENESARSTQKSADCNFHTATAEFS
jgi:hypothetical protein